MTGIDKDRFDAAEMLARIEHRLAESDKFRAEQNKMTAEMQKFGAEQQKLYAEGLKLQRDRWLAPVIVVATITAAVASVLNLILTK
jgi:hypothetical protein